MGKVIFCGVVRVGWYLGGWFGLFVFGCWLGLNV